MKLERVYILRMGYKGDVDREWKDVAETIIIRLEDRIRELLEDPEEMDEIIREVNEEFNTNLENPADVGSEFFIQFGKHKLSDVDKHVIRLKVLGLLEEIEKERKEFEKRNEEMEDEEEGVNFETPEDMEDYYINEGITVGLGKSKELIKKYFGDLGDF